MPYVPTPKEWIEAGAEALKYAAPEWDEHRKCDCDPLDEKSWEEHWKCPVPWPDRQWVAMEVIRGLREAGFVFVPLRINPPQ